MRDDFGDAPRAVAKPQHRDADRIDFVSSLRREHDEAIPCPVMVQAREAREGRPSAFVNQVSLCGE